MPLSILILPEITQTDAVRSELAVSMLSVGSMKVKARRGSGARFEVSLYGVEICRRQFRIR